MMGILNFCKEDEVDKCIESKFNVYTEGPIYGYGVSINTNLDMSYDDIISDVNKKYIRHEIMNQNDILNSLDRDEEKFLDFINSYLGRELNLIKDTKYISFDFEVDEIKDYLDKNPVLKDKIIVFKWDLDFEVQKLEKIEKVLCSEYKVLFELDGNSDLISLDECKKTCEILDSFVYKIKSMNLSVLEEIMYAYDIVRDREYVKEDKGESYTLSRDLSRVLLGDKIVCYGYANIFHHILEKLDIKSMMYNIKCRHISNTRHERVIVYVNDSKYNIEGVYYFDPTFDSKKNNNRNFLLSYRRFARTKEEMESMDKGQYEDVTFGTFGRDYVDDFTNDVKRNGIKNVSDEKIELINDISKFVNGKSLIPLKFFIDNPEVPDFLRVKFDLDETTNKLNKLVDLFSNNINARTFFRVVFNVRKLEYYSNQNDYPFGILEFINILHNTGIELEKTDVEILMESIFNKKLDDKDLFYKYRNYLAETGLTKDILRVKLTRKLANVLESKK